MDLSNWQQPGDTLMEGVRSGDGEFPAILTTTPEGRHVVRAVNQGGHDATEVDLVDLLRWVAEHRPELMPQAPQA